MNFEETLRMARQFVLTAGLTPEQAATNPIIPEKFREKIKSKLEEEARTVEFTPTTVIAEDVASEKWLENQDRGAWYYWPHLRDLHLTQGWVTDRIRSLDDSTDKILSRAGNPNGGNFERKGLVIGYVQSGKTANYSSLIAKAADVGYRMFIVLSGMDKGLRLQTQIRLQNELTGYHDNRRQGSVGYPESPQKRWALFTEDKTDGDFDPGRIKLPDVATSPVLMVIKKNGSVLRRLLRWLRESSSHTSHWPLLMVDDEADQASVDTRGGPAQQGDEDHNDPSTINKLIRQLLNCFQKKTYVAYTATPFANILIPADMEHPDSSIGSDIYPSDFIIDLPKSKDYVGAEYLFGQSAFTGEEDVDDGLDVIRFLPQSEGEEIPLEFLRDAVMDFVLAGSARELRDGKQPATMLVHVSRLIGDQRRIKEAVESIFDEIKDSWRYQRDEGIEEELKQRWEDFIRVTQETDPSIPIIVFDELAKNFIGPFLESTYVIEINSESGDILDYSSEPRLKTIVIGGDKLSRGLTLEGLLVSYFSRSTARPMYDTLMQMGRWFGYRKGYVDLTRIYTTPEIASNFAHLARVEQRLRDDLSIYEGGHVTPKEIGLRILSHPAMLVTNPSKSRYAGEFRVSYSEQLFQTFRFPLDDLESISASADKNLQHVRQLLNGHEKDPEQKHPFYRNINAEEIISFLENYSNEEHHQDIQDICRYVRDRVQNGELIRWNIAVMMALKENETYGVADWGVKVNQISRSRLCRKVNDLKSITSPGDEQRFLSSLEKEQSDRILLSEPKISSPLASRRVRSSEQGLIMLYPISKYSAPKGGNSNRGPLFDDPEHPQSRDLIGLAVSFPRSASAIPESYIHGQRPGWRT